MTLRDLFGVIAGFVAWLWDWTAGLVPFAQPVLAALWRAWNWLLDVPVIYLLVAGGVAWLIASRWEGDTPKGTSS